MASEVKLVPHKVWQLVRINGRYLTVSTYKVPGWICTPDIRRDYLQNSQEVSCDGLLANSKRMLKYTETLRYMQQRTRNQNLHSNK